MFAEILLLFISVALILYFVINTKHEHWKRKKIPGPIPTFFGGNTGEILSGKKSLGDVYAEIYNKYKNYPFVGIYKIFTKAILVIDPEIVKEVLIKDFSSFGENTITFTSDSPLVSKNPFLLKLNEWKPVRQQITSLVSSSKLKSTVNILNESAQKMVNFINRRIQENGSGVAELVAKEVTTRYTTNNVSKWVFGIEDENFADEPSELFKATNDLFQLSFLQNLSFLITMFLPSLKTFVKPRFLSTAVEKRMVSVIQQSVEYRIKNNVDSDDLLGTLIALRKSGSITDKELISHIGNVYIDGIESSSLMLHFVLYELAANPDAQENLRNEIIQTLTSNENDVISFESIQSMKYLDAVINETLRLHLLLAFLDKTTTKRTTLSGRTSDGQQIKVDIEAGTSVIVPSQGLHMDETYFPEAGVFKPERFYGEYKDNIPKCTFIPFGEGPRTCAGKLFGISQVKTGVVYVIKNFKVSLGDGTPYPAVLDPTGVLPLPKVPIKLKFQARESAK